MNDPQKRRGLPGSSPERDTKLANQYLTAVPRPYFVHIMVGAKKGKWGAYRDLESASEICARLRRNGMHAVVEDLSTSPAGGAK